MNDPTRVLYVSPDEATTRRLESVFADRRPDLALAGVTSLDSAFATLDAESVEHVVFDSSLADRTTSDPAAAIRARNDDVRTHRVLGVSSERPEVSSAVSGASAELSEVSTELFTERSGASAEEIRALADRIESAILDDSPEKTESEVRDDSSENHAEAVADGQGNRPAPVADGRGGDGEHFRALAQTLSDALLVIDADSVVQFANPAVEAVFGYRPDELVGESLTKLMSADLAERHRTGIQHYLDTDERNLDWQEVELTGKRKDGTEVPLRVSFGEFVSEGEVRFTGIVRDVSAQKRREAELRTRIRQQRAVAAFSQHALENRPPAELFDEAVSLVAEGLDHDYAGLLEYRPTEDDLLVRSVAGWDDSLAGSATIGTDSDSQAGYTLASADSVVSEDVMDDDRFDPDHLLTSADVRSGVSVVVGSPDDPWGVLGTHDTERRSFDDHDVQFVQSVAHILATAIRRNERERRHERAEAMLDAVGDGVYALDADSRFVAVNDAYCSLTGYDREELLGEHASTVLGDDLYEETRWVETALDDEDVVTLDGDLPTVDGREVPVEARIAPLRIDDEVGRVGVVRDVSERKRREEKLVVLTEMMGLLAETETPRAISKVAADTAVEVLDFQNVAVALYDDDANALVPTVRRWRTDVLDDALLGGRGDGVAWQTFVENESRTYDDLGAAVGADVTTPSVIAIPLGKHGVFLAGDSEPNVFDSTDASLADVLCSNVRSALDRADREEALRDQRNDLREKNRELERVNRLNRVIRELTKAVTQASSPGNVMAATCDRLTEVGPYRFAWFGEYDRTTDEVRPQASSGAEEGYLSDVTMRADPDDPRGNGPAGRAVREREVQVQNDLLGDPPFEPWREQALKRGYRSCVSVPVIYDESLRGVLSVYADESGAFNQMEQAVLAELGEIVGYAMTALEQKEALVSERSIELDFRIRGTGSAILGFVAETEAEFEFENAVQREDGRLHAFFTVSGVGSDETLAYARNVSWIEDVRLVAERDGENLYECALSDESFLRTLMNRGAIPRSITATEGEGRFVVRIPQNADVRTFVNLFEDYYEQADLVARRERDEPVLTRQDFETELRERLTDRQEEVVQIAYFGGFFEWPRESTAEEIADALGVSQPTVSRHLRGAERALFGLLLED